MKTQWWSLFTGGVVIKELGRGVVASADAKMYMPSVGLSAASLTVTLSPGRYDIETYGAYDEAGDVYITLNF